VNSSNSLDAKIDGVIAGLGSNYSTESSVPDIKISYPSIPAPVYAPSRVRCLTEKDFIGGI
jgi:hypothetical protein